MSKPLELLTKCITRYNANNCLRETFAQTLKFRKTRLLFANVSNFINTENESTMFINNTLHSGK